MSDKEYPRVLFVKANEQGAIEGIECDSFFADDGHNIKAKTLLLHSRFFPSDSTGKEAPEKYAIFFAVS